MIKELNVLNVSKTSFTASLKAPIVCLKDSHGLGELYEQWYAKQDMERDFTRVSFKQSLEHCQ